MRLTRAEKLTGGSAAVVSAGLGGVLWVLMNGVPVSPPVTVGGPSAIPSSSHATVPVARHPRTHPEPVIVVVHHGPQPSPVAEALHAAAAFQKPTPDTDASADTDASPLTDPDAHAFAD